MISLTELERRCEWVLRRNEKLLLKDGRISADFYFGKGEGSLLWEFRFDRLADWFNDGGRTELLFSIIRHSLEDAGYDCAIFASDVWSFECNDRGMAVGYKAVLRLSMDERVAAGFGHKVEALVVTGQTPQYSALLAKPYFRDIVDPNRVFKVGPEKPRAAGSINQLSGRQKMFGDWKEPGMKDAYQLVGREVMPHLRAKMPMARCTTLVNIAVEDP